jgi:hypothetical protein
MTRTFLLIGYALLLSLTGAAPRVDETRSFSGLAQTCLSTHVFNDCNSSGYITFGFNAISGAGTGVSDPLTIQRSNMDVGINNNTPQAKLHIKGGGTDNTTSSLLVNNNANAELFRILDNGNVGIGTANPQSTLAVSGNITAKKIVVTSQGWSDYVFDDDYHLPALPQVEEYIHRNRHLPEVISAEEVKKNGVDLGASQAILLKKVEELTLYLIEEHKELKKLKEQNQQLEAKLNARLH